jgi:hypothetical protein
VEEKAYVDFFGLFDAGEKSDADFFDFFEFLLGMWL